MKHEEKYTRGKFSFVIRTLSMGDFVSGGAVVRTPKTRSKCAVTHIW